MTNFIKKIRTSVDSWSFASILLVTLICIPLITIGIKIFEPSSENLEHIKEYLLPEYIKNTIIVAVGTGFFTIVIGVTLAWYVSMYDFKGRDFFSWALILPLAIPSYIAGYAYSGLFSYTGFIATVMRNNYGKSFRFNIMNIYGVIFIFTLCFYPYVYLVVKSFFSRQSTQLIEASRSLGKSKRETFFRVILPLARGAIVAGSSLAILEVLNAYGLVSHFGVSTFSTGIFRVWLSFGDSNSGVKLAALLMLFTFLTLVLEKILRKRRSFSYSTTKIRPIKREELKGKKEVYVITLITFIFLVAFIIPIMQLVYWAYLTYDTMLNRELFIVIKNTFVITAFSSLIIIVISVVIANTVRLRKNLLTSVISKLATMGYSIPGAVIAIGMMLSCVSLDKFLNPLYNIIGIEKNLVLTLSFALLISAYIVRFLAVSFNSIESGFDKIGTKFHEASRSLGKGINETFIKVDFPMIKGSLMGAFILVFIEIIKELPLTLVLRPFNFHTLATLAKQYAEDEMVAESSIPSLIIVFICFLAIYFFNKLGERRKK